jgi:hypothetical protein
VTEEVVAPLDAYATAKPDEPVFTLQGGDPLAAPLVRLWAQLARLRTGLGKGLWPPSFTDAENAVLNHDVSHDEKESANLLLRATAAEEVSWAMDAYVNGNRNSDVPTEAEDTHLDELKRIDLHDVRVRVAQRLSNIASELTDLDTVLRDAGYIGPWPGTPVTETVRQLKKLNECIEPRRIFKKD